MTREERCEQRKLLELLVDTGEGYQREVENDRELYQVIALDAKGIPERRITARHAADLLVKVARKGSECRERIGTKRAVQIGRVGFRAVARRPATAH